MDGEPLRSKSVTFHTAPAEDHKLPNLKNMCPSLEEATARECIEQFLYHGFSQVNFDVLLHVCELVAHDLKDESLFVVDRICREFMKLIDPCISLPEISGNLQMKLAETLVCRLQSAESWYAIEEDPIVDATLRYVVSLLRRDRALNPAAPNECERFKPIMRPLHFERLKLELEKHLENCIGVEVEELKFQEKLKNYERLLKGNTTEAVTIVFLNMMIDLHGRDKTRYDIDTSALKQSLERGNADPHQATWYQAKRAKAQHYNVDISNVYKLDDATPGLIYHSCWENLMSDLRGVNYPKALHSLWHDNALKLVEKHQEAWDFKNCDLRGKNLAALSEVLNLILIHPSLHDDIHQEYLKLILLLKAFTDSEWKWLVQIDMVTQGVNIKALGDLPTKITPEFEMFLLGSASAPAGFVLTRSNASTSTVFNISDQKAVDSALDFGIRSKFMAGAVELPDPIFSMRVGASLVLEPDMCIKLQPHVFAEARLKPHPIATRLAPTVHYMLVDNGISTRFVSFTEWRGKDLAQYVLDLPHCVLSQAQTFEVLKQTYEILRELWWHGVVFTSLCLRDLCMQGDKVKVANLERLFPLGVNRQWMELREDPAAHNASESSYYESLYSLGIIGCQLLNLFPSDFWMSLSPAELQIQLQDCMSLEAPLRQFIQFLCHADPLERERLIAEKLPKVSEHLHVTPGLPRWKNCEEDIRLASRICSLLDQAQDCKFNFKEELSRHRQIDLSHVAITPNKDVAVCFFHNVREKFVVVAFQSQPAWLEHLTPNALVSPSGVNAKVHSKFWKIAGMIPIEPFLELIRAGYRIIVTGHRLGGFVAQLFGLLLMTTSKVELPQIYYCGFGVPFNGESLRNIYLPDHWCNIVSQKDFFVGFIGAIVQLLDEAVVGNERAKILDSLQDTLALLQKSNLKSLREKLTELGKLHLSSLHKSFYTDCCWLEEKGFDPDIRTFAKMLVGNFSDYPMAVYDKKVVKESIPVDRMSTLFPESPHKDCCLVDPKNVSLHSEVVKVQWAGTVYQFAMTLKHSFRGFGLPKGQSAQGGSLLIWIVDAFFPDATEEVHCEYKDEGLFVRFAVPVESIKQAKLQGQLTLQPLFQDKIVLDISVPLALAKEEGYYSWVHRMPVHCLLLQCCYLALTNLVDHKAVRKEIENLQRAVSGNTKLDEWKQNVQEHGERDPSLAYLATLIALERPYQVTILPAASEKLHEVKVSTLLEERDKVICPLGYYWVNEWTENPPKWERTFRQKVDFLSSGEVADRAVRRIDSEINLSEYLMALSLECITLSGQIAEVAVVGLPWISTLRFTRTGAYVHKLIKDGRLGPRMITDPNLTAEQFALAFQDTLKEWHLNFRKRWEDAHRVSSNFESQLVRSEAKVKSSDAFESIERSLADLRRMREGICVIGIVGRIGAGKSRFCEVLGDSLANSSHHKGSRTAHGFAFVPSVVFLDFPGTGDTDLRVRRETQLHLYMCDMLIVVSTFRSQAEAEAIKLVAEARKSGVPLLLCLNCADLATKATDEEEKMEPSAFEAIVTHRFDECTNAFQSQLVGVETLLTSFEWTYEVYKARKKYPALKGWKDVLEWVNKNLKDRNKEGWDEAIQKITVREKESIIKKWEWQMRDMPTTTMQMMLDGIVKELNAPEGVKTKAEPVAESHAVTNDTATWLNARGFSSLSSLADTFETVAELLECFVELSPSKAQEYLGLPEDMLPLARLALAQQFCKAILFDPATATRFPSDRLTSQLALFSRPRIDTKTWLSENKLSDIASFSVDFPAVSDLVHAFGKMSKEEVRDHLPASLPAPSKLLITTRFSKAIVSESNSIAPSWSPSRTSMTDSNISGSPQPSPNFAGSEEPISPAFSLAAHPVPRSASRAASLTLPSMSPLAAVSNPSQFSVSSLSLASPDDHSPSNTLLRVNRNIGVNGSRTPPPPPPKFFGSPFDEY